MKAMIFLSACALGLSLSSCKAPQSAANPGEKITAGKNYPLNISFKADYMVMAPSQGVLAIDRSGFWQPGVSRINTHGQGYYMTLDGNTVQADLPYYGQRDLFRDVYEEAGILLKDKTLENISYGRTSDNKILALEFDVRRNTERFHVELVIMRNKKAYLFVKSPHRQSIRYEGSVASL